MKYKINIHAHSVFSDGRNTPVIMAKVAHDLGFSALVITDHFYGGDDLPWCSISKEKYKTLKNACREATDFLPVITGLEVCTMQNEILVFGGEAIKRILESGVSPSKDDLLKLREETHCAMVLCHPHDIKDDVIDVIDGYEQCNSGIDYSKFQSFDNVKHLQAWCNSDAHCADSLDRAYNFVDSKITTEHDLIKYIKNGKQPEHFLKIDE